MSRFLLDTNHLSATIRRVSLLRDRIRQRHRGGDRFITCVPVLCELEVGIQGTGAVEANHRRLNTVLEIVKIWPLDADTPPRYAELYLKAQARGQLMTPVDLFLATLANLRGAIILTTDQDFTALPEVPTENWLA